MNILSIALAWGCASARPPLVNAPSASYDHAAVTPRGGTILPAEILLASSQTAYDAVLKLRPSFFARGRWDGHEIVTPSVVLQKGFPESLEVLKLVAADQVAEIRFVEPVNATVTYGPAYTSGVIVVILR